jgi:hypothetical protein
MPSSGPTNSPTTTPSAVPTQGGTHPTSMPTAYQENLLTCNLTGTHTCNNCDYTCLYEPVVASNELDGWNQILPLCYYIQYPQNTVLCEVSNQLICIWRSSMPLHAFVCMLRSRFIIIHNLFSATLVMGLFINSKCLRMTCHSMEAQLILGPSWGQS